MADQDELAVLRAEVEALRTEVTTLRAAAAATMAGQAQACTCSATATGFPGAYCPVHGWRVTNWVAGAAAGGYAGHVVQIPSGGEFTCTATYPAANAWLGWFPYADQGRCRRAAPSPSSSAPGDRATDRPSDRRVPDSAEVTPLEQEARRPQEAPQEAAPDLVRPLPRSRRG